MFKVGDRVRICKNSDYYGESNHNPAEEEGTVTLVEEGSLGVTVDWDNGFSNSYDAEDLYLVATKELKKLMADDPVNQPKHYEIFRGIEAKDVMKVVAESDIVKHLSPWEVHCFLTSLKYRLRAGEKDGVEQELAKAKRYKECLE